MQSSSRCVVLLGMFLILGSTLSASSQALFRARPAGGATTYRVTWDYSYDQVLEEPSQPLVTYHVRGRNQGTAEIPLLAPTQPQQTAYRGQGTCSGSAYYRATFHLPDGDVYQEADCSGQEVASTFPALLVLYPDGTYDFTPADSSFDGTGFDSVSGTRFPASKAPEVPELRSQPQGQNSTINFEGVVPKAVLQTQTLSIQLHATLTPVGPPPKLVLKQTAMVNPEVGTPITGTVVKVGTAGSPVPIRFILEEVTSEPGQCLNGADAGTDPDLDFADSGNAGVFRSPSRSGTTGWIMETREPRTSATCQIAVRDYGAWGKLRAEAYYDGKWNAVPVDKSRLAYTTVPLDANLNKIADKWERDNRLKNPTGGADLEKTPRGDGATIGDGFSNYEEYRGLFARGKHVRLNPNVKELVVGTAMGSQADRGLSLFQSASGFNVVRLDPSELDSGRVVNEHHGLFHNGDQHGLRLVSEPIGGGVVGEAVPITLAHKRPKDCTVVRVDPAPIQASPPPAGFDAEFAATIAHELAHAVGVEHHGDPVQVTANRDLTERDADHYHLFGADGKPLSLRHLDGALGGPHSDASGDVSCVMCYTSRYQWCVVPPMGPDFSIYAAQLPVTGTRFCTSARGTGMNAGGKYFGDAARGDCLAQMRVKDY